MSTRSERLFGRLNTQEDLESLIGQPEDGDFDCKEWQGRSETSRGSLAKAACGFANATGGVIIIGAKASGRTTSETPDVVQGLAPVVDRKAAASDALDIILKFVEPGIEGIEIKDIPYNNSDKAGFVLIHVPESDSTPRRTKSDWKFYVRVASGTIPMEYFQIEDRFGRRPHPKLVLEVSPEYLGRVTYPFQGVLRTVKLSTRNDGRGIARFPCLRYRRSSAFEVLNHMYYPERPVWTVYAFTDWTSIRGDSNQIIYPGETFVVATMAQRGQASQSPNAWDFPPTDLEIELLCDDMPRYRQTLQFGATTFK